MLKRLIVPLTCLLLLSGAAHAQDDSDVPVTEDAEEVVVSAERVSIEEVIKAIGLKMEQEQYRMQDISYTTLVTQILRDDPGMELNNYSIEEYAMRFHHDREEGDQMVQLWERTRKYEDGELGEDESEDKVRAEWLDAQDQGMESMPFAPGGSGNYNYTILERRNVGNSLIY
jgi:hypothetical protein